MTTEKQEWRYPNIRPPSKGQKLYPRKSSILDTHDPNSGLNKSNFRGFFNLLIIFGGIFLCTSSILNYLQNGYLLSPGLFNTFKTDFFLCVLVWPLFFLWSFTSFIIQKLIIWGINQHLAMILQHSTQAGLFIFSILIIFKYQWCSTHISFVILQACVHFMKMHSYTTVNRDYRQQYIIAIKQNNKVLSDYPNNVNLYDFLQFMWTPWLVYDKYPRRQSVSILYILRNGFGVIIGILTAYILHTQYIMTWIQLGNKISYLQLIFRLMFPSTLLIIVLFYVVFDCMVNLFAQITKLDFRQYYQDWWNSTTYQQFNRKWNKPVHYFLYRHLYLQLMIRWKTSKKFAHMFTFMFSAALHQFYLAMIFKTIRPIFIIVILAQIPLIYMTQSLQGTRWGSYGFWLGIIFGPSFIISCYLRVDSSITQFFTKLT